MLPLELSCQDVRDAMARQEDVVLIDCREPDEHAVAVLPNARLLPMMELPERVAEVADDLNKRIIIYCHHGVRSARVAAWLRRQGFAQAQSMAGGIDEWAQTIDPGIPRY